MARDLAPIVKRSRREQTALHPKAIKGLSKRNYAPGEHGQMARRSKPSQYSVQLREKQKVKRIYGLLEKQFSKVVAESNRMSGVAGENLLQLLERRIDNAVYRAGFATSRRAARQLVSHAHMRLNGRRVDVPSILLKPGDEVEVRATSHKNAYFEALKALASKNQQSVSWLSVNSSKLNFKVTGLPSRDDADQDIAEQLIIEFYSR